MKIKVSGEPNTTDRKEHRRRVRAELKRQKKAERKAEKRADQREVNAMILKPSGA